MSATRPCEHCGAPIPASARSHAMFCSGRCKVAAYRARGTVTPKQTVTPKAAKPETVTEQTVTATACFDAGTVTEPGISVTELNYATPESVTSVDFIEPVTLSKPVIDVPESVTEAETVTPKAGSVTEAVRPKPIPAGTNRGMTFTKP